MSKICLMCGETFSDATAFCPHDGSALRAAVRGDDLIGEVFCERYVATDLLGTGGMGAVYLARDIRLPQQVAIKVLHDRSNADATVVSRFRQEAEAASRINHDRVARVNDFGFMADGRAYIIMEYVGGKTLKKWIEERGALSLSECAKITAMVAEGLDAAHKLGIVHRDLKPENVMVVDDADGGMRVKVLDFGIAKVLQPNGAAEYTAPGFVIGTPLWMSPEQILGTQLDARSDVFALGLLVYAMLTGRRPYTRATDQEEMLARLSAAPTPLTEIRPDLQWPVGLQAFIGRALSRDANARPSGAMALARELSTLVEKPTVSVVSPPVLTRKRPVAAIGATVLLLLAGTVVAVKWLGPNGPAKAASITRVDSIARNVPTVAQKESLTTPGAQNSGTRPETTTVGATETAGQVTSTPANRTTPLGNKPDSKGAKNGGTDATKAGAPATTLVATVPDAGANNAAAAEELEQLMRESDADIGPDVDNATKRSHARSFVPKLGALLSRLTNSSDRGWALLYLGKSHELLGDTLKACSALARARAIGVTTRLLQTGIKTQQDMLRCS